MEPAHMQPHGHSEPIAPLLRVRDFAQLVNLSERSVWTAISAGRIATVRLGPRATRIEQSELARFIAEAKRSAQN